MPIYAYRCETCGHAKDVLQKVSDPVLSTCPACGAETFRKQVTAAGFQLKGSGWYVTDFRGGDTSKNAAKGDSESSGADKSSKADSAASSSDKKPAESADKSSATDKSSAAAPAAAAAPAPASDSAKKSTPPAGGPPAKS